MITPDDTTRILMRVEHAMGACTEIDEAAATFMRVLQSEIPQVTWAGVYWLQAKELVLGPFSGPETEYVRIPMGDGICGTAAAEGTNRIVQDVRLEDNYLACSATTRSEIVVLIRDTFGGVLGLIDADSDQVGGFDHTDEMLLEAVGTRLAAFVRRRSAAGRDADATGSD